MKFEIKTKYNIGDEVYFLYSPNTYKHGVITDINFVELMEESWKIRYTINYNKFDTMVANENFIFESESEIKELIFQNELKDFYNIMQKLKENSSSPMPIKTLPEELIPFHKKLQEIKEMLEEFYDGFHPKEKYQF